MAKYIIALMVLASLAFENSNIHKRLCVESLPSVRAADTSRDRQHQYRAAHLTDKLYASHHHRHKHTRHHKRHHHPNPNHHHQITTRKVVKRQSNLETSSIESDKKIYAAHLRRHQEQQREHLQHHREHYQKQRQQELTEIPIETATSSEESAENLKSMPRPWQHLSQTPYDRMYGDAPIEEDVNDDDGDGDSGVDENAIAAEAADLAFKQIVESLAADTANEDEGFEDSLADDSNLLQSESLESVEVPEEVSAEVLPKKHKSSHHSRHSSKHRCPKCEVQRQVEHITEEELTRLRIEFVKTQILEKLRLKERPKVSPVALPKPIQEGVTIDQGDENAKNKELDDYYARTSKKFIFLERETLHCNRTNVPKSICFSFKIDDADADGFDVNTAALWIFKKSLKSRRKHQLKPTLKAHNSSSSNNKNNSNSLINHEDIVVYEVTPTEDKDFQPVSKTIAIKRIDKNVSDKWLEIHIEWPIQRWFGNHDLSHLIQISCESCDINDIEDMISIDKDYRPFIMIDTQNRRRVSRQKRSINCTDGVTECCREKLYISFDEIGWGDWIIQPRGYDAYFCRGSCGTVASVTQSSSHHNTFLQKVIAKHNGNGQKPLELIPCCTAKQYSSLQLVFMDSNNTATQKTFPNMVVESCGCR